MTETNSGEISWDGEIDPTQESKPRQPLLPDGTARFVCLKIERKRQEYGKYGTINVAVLTLVVSSMVDAELEPVMLRENIGLHTDLMWKLTEFFTAIGQHKHGDTGKFVPNWAKVDGSEGYAILQHRELETKKEPKKKYKVNDLAKFCTKEEAEADVIEDKPKF